ncbi:branched-chain amino acid ABC transporter permease [Bordetella bronchiseptica]|uniref:ABC transport system, permease protein n=3 Tax=Bordetella bronchiseptica TaxID=518 RepID=A0A0H3LT33_BORBR|nr:branched-chain amino acid ABC transporter permease [Bordetella bronchiseptica]KAK68535.1 branched-chain amino acid ABC transporter, permease protein [Bordetella bronchiseptica 980-2]KDD49217.1 branched-chain amino acid ABC transporter, permease protein [Bordetella bronchiseptica OSU553]AMG90776.2 branched-chain amino acid ABC transporter permease [Bordetella bronchiseptica]AWP74306.1 branched-chain amino acid ABC transporter permease [Bordetella bronchiseptica]AWP79132.1 branched-chain amin
MMEAYLIAIFITVLIYMLLAGGLALQYGFTGLINFGHVGFYAIGAYTSALLSLQGVPLVACILAATLVSGLSAYPLGVIALRLRGDYLAIVTLGFSESVRMILQKEEWLTRGVHGIPGIPRLFGQYASGAMVDVLILATLLLTNILVFLGIRKIIGSPFGRTIKAIRDNEVAVMALGKNPAWFKTRSLMIGAALAGLAGAFTAHYLTFIAPEQFVPLITFYVWIAIIVGGVGSLKGVVAGTVILMVFLEGSRFVREFLFFDISEVQMASLRFFIIGVGLILCILYRPNGIFGSASAEGK